ncbi:hypothetical protein C8J56DRAFT_928647 [Mycena floridula]|nr:hypothetical protein C8J56DRAFT_928647 [Mycena floridula]
MSTPPQSLTEWLQTNLTGRYFEKKEEGDQANAAAPVVFAPNAQIFLNHVSTSIEEYQQHHERNLMTSGATVEWKDVIEVPDSEEEGKAHEAGIVAGFLVVTRSMKFKVRATAAKSQTLITLSAKIEQSGEDSEPDKRRIVQLFHTAAQKAVPIHIQGLRS